MYYYHSIVCYCNLPLQYLDGVGSFKYDICIFYQKNKRKAYVAVVKGKNGRVKIGMQDIEKKVKGNFLIYDIIDEKANLDFVCEDK